MKKIIVIMLALTLCIALAACGGGSAPADTGSGSGNASAGTPSKTPDAPAPTGDNVIKIGALVNLTGFQAPIDLASTNEVKAFVSIINERGGWEINGEMYQVDFITSDLQSDATLARSAALYLVDQGVDYVIETVDFMVTGVQDIWDDNKTLHATTWATGDPNYGGPNHPYAFLGSGGSLSGYKSAMQTWMKAFPEGKTIAYCEDDKGINPDMHQLCVDYANELGLTVLPEMTVYAGDQTDFSSIAMSLIKTGAQGFIGAGPITNVAAITKELRALGSDMWYIMPGTQSLIVFSHIVGEEGARNAVGIGGLPVPELNNDMYMDTYYRYKETVGDEEAAIYNGNYPSVVYQLLQFMSAAGSTDVDTVIAKIETMDKVDTFYGEGPLGGFEYYGIKNRVVCAPAGVTVLGSDGEITFDGYIPAYLP